MSPSPASEIMLMQKKLGRQRVQLADAHQCTADVQTCDETKRLVSVQLKLERETPCIAGSAA